MDDLLTLAEASAFIKELIKKYGRQRIGCAIPPQSLVVQVRNATLAGEVVSGALHIRKSSLLKMYGLDADPAAAKTALPEPVAPPPAWPQTSKRATRCPDVTGELAEVLVELRAIRGLISKAVGGSLCL